MVSSNDFFAAKPAAFPRKKLAHADEDNQQQSLTEIRMIEAVPWQDFVPPPAGWMPWNMPESFLQSIVRARSGVDHGGKIHPGESILMQSHHA